MRRRPFLLLALLLLAALIAPRAIRPPAFAPARAGAALPGAERLPRAAVLRSDAAPALPTRAAGAERLFTYGRPADAAALDAALPAPSPEIHYVRVNQAWLAGKDSPFWRRPGEGRLELPLPGGGSLAVVLADSEMLGADRFVSRGRIEGRPDSRAAFAWNQGFLHATVEDGERGTFVLRTATAEWSQFYRVDAALVAPCGGERRPVIDAAVMAALDERRRRAPAGGEPGGVAGAAPATGPAVESTQRAEVHLMMLHTPAVLTTLSGGARTAALQSAFDLAIERVNVVLAASLVSTRVKLVRVAETAYARDRAGGGGAVTDLQENALTALYRTTDGEMDEIHPLRDQAGADMVMLVLNGRDAVSSGLSFLLDQPGEDSNSLFAFSVVQYGNVAGTHVVAHELGHVFGCAHDRENAASGQGAYPFSYGYWFYGADGRRYRDIMAYPPGEQLAYFSTPRVSLPAPISAPIGIAAGRQGESDTARTIEENAFAVAHYRLQTQAAVNAGTLVNVATRAFVGTGEQVLIGGFVVGGTEPKRMLIRAVGPALGAFGVSPTLPDPELSIVPLGGTRAAMNDNWGALSTGSTAADIAAAAAQVGAFPLPPGSLDAAVLTTLSPGPYTAVVEGRDGATGIGLVEAYEVGPGMSRIVNLATRGYVDGAGKELVGGFVVYGPTGSTKRVLVRVLGPSLGREPHNMTGTLFDPWMELRGADGRILLQNDDWSSGARIVSGTRDDFQPTVRIYDEQQIAATGFAPANRREPCILVDLAPGNYTVVVKPFEKLDVIPPQPAQPGVGIVEVYEIER